MPDIDDTYTIEVEDDLSWTITIADQGVAVPADHASTHAAAGADPITISPSQVSGLGTLATQDGDDVSITGGSVTGITDLAIADGGTGASDVTTARSNLGLGSIATQAASSVTITGGSVTGITDITVADGGTGASTASGARTNLGLGTIATQAASSVTITGGTIDGVLIGDGNPQDGGFADLTADTITVLGALQVGSLTINTPVPVDSGGTGADTAAAARTNLGLGTIATQNSTSISVSGGAISGTTIGAASPSSGAFTTLTASTPVAVASGGTGASTASTARTNLGLGSIATQAASSVAITGGSVTGITDLTVADGGTGASTATGALANLKILYGTVALSSGNVVVSIGGMVAGSFATGNYASSGTGAQGKLTFDTSVADQLTISSDSGTDDNDVTYVIINL